MKEINLDKKSAFYQTCRTAGKMCGLLSSPKNHLAELLENTKSRHNQIPSAIFAKKSPEAITEDDLLEIGLYEKILAGRSAGELLIRHENLKKIYAKEQQYWFNRETYSLPDNIHYWNKENSDKSLATIAKNHIDHYSTSDELKKTEEMAAAAKLELCDELYQSELCTIIYTVKSKQVDRNYWQIIQAQKQPISDPDQYFLQQLENTLRTYFDGRNCYFFRLGEQSESSKALYNELYDTILRDEDPHKKIKKIIARLNREFTMMQKPSAETGLKNRRLISMLDEAGFMIPDILNWKPILNASENAESQSNPNETQASHPLQHK